MKKLFLILLSSLCFGFTASFAQAKIDTVAKKTKYKKFVEAKGRDRLFLVLNHENVFHKETNGFATSWYSRGIGLYFMWDFQIKKSKFSVAPGIGYNYAAYFHNAEIREDSTGISFPIIHDLKTDENFKRARLGVHYIDIPIELRFRQPTKTGMSVKLALGIKGSIKVNATHKEVKKGPNNYFKHYNTANYKDVNQFRFGPTFRVGYGAFNVMMYYNMLPLFDKGRGPLMHPFSIGIAFTTL